MHRHCLANTNDATLHFRVGVCWGVPGCARVYRVGEVVMPLGARHGRQVEDSLEVGYGRAGQGKVTTYNVEIEDWLDTATCMR